MYNKICGKGNGMVLFAYNFNSLVKSTAWIYTSIQICLFQKKQFHKANTKNLKPNVLFTYRIFYNWLYWYYTHVPRSTTLFTTSRQQKLRMSYRNC